MKNIYLSFTFIVLASINLSGQTFNCGDSLLDTRDGQKYATVLIGSDCWFKQNLNYGTMVNSDSSGTIHSDQSNNSIPEKYAQNNNSANLLIYGGLYEWAELMNYATTSGGQGFCPSGWHVSTDAEWSNLISQAGATMITSTEGNGGNKLKKIGEGFGSGAGTDIVGFSGKHGGDRDGFGIFYGMGNRAIFWTSTLQSPGQAYNYHLWGGKDTLQKVTTGTSTTAFACRCVKDLTSTGVNNNFINNNIFVYPNPASDIIEIDIENSIIGSGYEIFDMLGQVILSGNLLNNKNRIDVTILTKGLYIIRIGNQSERKIIITGN